MQIKPISQEKNLSFSIYKIQTETRVSMKYRTDLISNNIFDGLIELETQVLKIISHLFQSIKIFNSKLIFTHIKNQYIKLLRKVINYRKIYMERLFHKYAFSYYFQAYK